MQGASSQDGATPYTLHEAAQLLGVSLNTVRRKIARGELKATRSPRPQGHVWHVWLQPAQGSTQHPPTEQVQDAASILPVDRAEQLAQALVPLVEAAVAPLRAELAEVRAMLSACDQELGAALERIRMLEAPREPEPSPDALGRDSEGSPPKVAQDRLLLSTHRQPCVRGAGGASGECAARCACWCPHPQRQARCRGSLVTIRSASRRC